MVRIAVVDRDSCRPKDCGHPCRKYCPIVRTGGEAIYFNEEKMPPIIDEIVCTGCGICVKRCPFEALGVVNLPETIQAEAFHRYSVNGFILFRFPEIQPNSVIGILGENGIGKSTLLKIMSGQITPNLGQFEKTLSPNEVLRRMRGSTSMNVLRDIWNGKTRVSFKPQHVDALPRLVSGKVNELLAKIKEESVDLKYVSGALGIDSFMDEDVSKLSGGELQRLAIAASILREADVYLLDEPSSFLDVEQRMRVARLIHSLKSRNKIIIVVEHDLALMDYLTETVFIVYGEPSTYGIVSRAMSSRVGINSYLSGYIKAENTRFKKESITFHTRPPPSEKEYYPSFNWRSQDMEIGNFKLRVDAGEIHNGEVLGLVGPNAIGKTTFVLSIIKEYFSGDSAGSISYKPQYISDIFDGTVSSTLSSSFGNKDIPSWIDSELIRPLRLNRLLDHNVKELSGGELQALAVAATLIKPASFYLIDEPCAYLDVEQRLVSIRAIRRMVKSKTSAAFVVEHDILAVDFLSDRLVVFEGKPGIEGHAKAPSSMEQGMNDFLKILDVTFRRDVDTKRPRINKPGSRLDRDQREDGKYYYS